MAGIWDFLDSLPKRGDVTPEELARRRQGYADLYQGGLLARNRDQAPLSVRGAQATQDFMPVIGDLVALGEAGDAFSRGELAAAGLLGAGAAIGLVPGAGDALAKPVMAAGRRAADIARRIEVDPNALGSMGGNIRLRPQAGGGNPDPTQTGWVFKDVDRSLKTSKLENRRIAGDTSRVEEVPIRQLYATQPTVNSDFATTSSSAGEMPLVVRKNGKMFVQDGHHRLTKKAEDGSQTAKVRFIDLDNKDTSTPLLDWSPEKTGFVEADQDLLNELFAPTTPAQEVAGLLSSGRANEVTDEMLAKFTPNDEKEMFDLYQRGATGMDLPMDEASRMARAQGMGLVDDQYHATPFEFRQFMPSQTGLSGRGVYTGDDPSDILDYARVDSEGDLRVIPVRAPSEKTLARNIDFQNTIEADSDFPYNASVDETVAGFKRAADTLSDQGYSGVYSQAGERVTFDPANIRSRFARFDPRLAHLRNLSAGVGGLGLLSSMMPPEEQY